MMIYVNIHGLKLAISTAHPTLAKSIEDYYRMFLVNSLDVVDIEIHLDRFGYFTGKKIHCPAGFLTVGDYVKIEQSEKKYYFENIEISGLIHYQNDGKIFIQGALKPHKIRHWVNILLQGFTRIEKYYNRFIIKTLIHDIVFVELEKRFGIGLLHATAVTNGVQTYVFTGLGGSGKSTLAAAFHKKGFTILSDNYALIKGNELYPFPELPRITVQTSNLLQLQQGEKADGIKTYLKNSLDTAKDMYDIDKIFICSYGKNLKISPIKDPESVFEILSSINHYTKEFPEYSNLALLSLLGEYNSTHVRIKNLESIANVNKIYFLNNISDLETALNSIENV